MARSVRTTASSSWKGEPPQDPPHATAISLVAGALREAIGTRALIREQMPVIVAPYSAPEPDVAVVAGGARDYSVEHPRSALLIVEIASSLPQDRLSKSRIHAAAAVPEYWIVNVREECVEIFRAPDQARRLYEGRSIAGRGESITLLSFPDATLAVDDLLPR